MAQGRFRREASGKTAIITGGASGIGAALARALAAGGADVVIADRQTDLAETIADGLRSAGGAATAMELDVRELASMRHVVESTARRTGKVDLFFNNAGIGVAGEIAGYGPSDW